VLLNQIDYNSYGNVIGQSNPSVTFRFDYTGREWDGETGQYYYRARYYDPRVGQFISQDPIGFTAGDANLYRYVFNSPTNFTDPSGEKTAPVRPAPVRNYNNNSSRPPAPQRGTGNVFPRGSGSRPRGGTGTVGPGSGLGVSRDRPFFDLRVPFQPYDGYLPLKDGFIYEGDPRHPSSKLRVQPPNAPLFIPDILRPLPIGPGTSSLPAPPPSSCPAPSFGRKFRCEFIYESPPTPKATFRTCAYDCKGYGAPAIFPWPKDLPCPGSFNGLFPPIPPGYPDPNIPRN
jgi:RHS repeat-associated protein